MTTITTLSSKGQVVLPRMVRSQLHLAPGTKLLCEVQGDSVVLTPEHPRRSNREYVIDPLTGLRVTKAREQTEPVTSEMIKALLEDYP
ncbi:AbrB/MazE/SpoVT family DNA-binding domain-containing protein [Phragmitibacter flavus]|uniref:AbrB/MazE/SpoVT family DNA-binding domain-containing protein n=1 Tax=Phragmitibacter flavus TaxID=2576071 RepID=A0A5R8KBH5_9BACT|nr:AbrB/MazE/SpoVT family DNA-binding domain-containing protein [Phragmitibacter flavus]TLD69607.1 AbrB/MazE/SpoVT family DNA-binding domain-containing protein [Phragmitibacter flavus]